MVDKDVEITDEHVANLEALVKGIADGSIDLSDTIENGVVTLGDEQDAQLLTAASEEEVDIRIVEALYDTKDKVDIPYQSFYDVQNDLNALLSAGIIDSAGNFVAKFVLQEGGKDAELDAVAQRIQGGGTVGSLTIDGNSVSPDFITQIYKVKRLLVIAQKTAQNEMTFDLLNEEIQLGDYFSNLPGISADYLSKLGAELKFLIRDPAIAEAIPADASDSGKVSTQDGKYVAPCINGESYEEAHSFTSSESGTTFWYSVDEYDGVVAGNTVSLNYSYANNVIEARLNRQQPGDVSFDWKIVSSVMNNSQSLSGTITWAADDGGIKVIPLQVPGDRGGDLWRGKRANAVFSASNIENAIFAGGATGWSHVIQGSRDDQKEIAVSTGEYSMPTLTADQFTKYDVKNYQGNYERWYVKRITGLPQNIEIARITPLLDKANGNLYCTVYLVSPDAEVGGEPVITYENQRMDNFHLYYHQSKFLRWLKSVPPITSPSPLACR